MLLGGCDSKPIADAKDGVREDLKDLSSAELKDVRVCENDKEVVVGAVNSKNGFGAYGGFESFFAIGTIAVFANHPWWEALNIRCFGLDIVNQTKQAFGRPIISAEEARHMTERTDPNSVYRRSSPPGASQKP